MKKLIIMMIFCFTFCLSFGCGTETQHTNFLNKNYTLEELDKIASSSFKRLNEVQYPDEEVEKYAVSEEYQRAVSGFSLKMYSDLNRLYHNVVFSPLSLYTNLSLLSLFCEDESLNTLINGLLQTTKEVRNEQVPLMIQNDYFSTEIGTLKMKNAAFIDQQFTVKPTVLSDLTHYYCEAFGMDYSSEEDIYLMLSWINNAIQEKDYIKKDDLSIDDNTMMTLISTLFVNNRWLHTFDTTNTKEAIFTNLEGSSYNRKFMTHSYYGDVYDYDTYYSVYDYYYNDISVQYLIPKEANENSIYDLIQEDFIHEDQERKITSAKYSPSQENNKRLVVDLAVPIFETEQTISFCDILDNIGLGSLFSPTSKALNGGFDHLAEDDSIYVQEVKQANKVSFDETGTVIKNTSYSNSGYGSTNPHKPDTIMITLDCPFIYVIYDSNHLPIMIGNMNG